MEARFLNNPQRRGSNLFGKRARIVYERNFIGFSSFHTKFQIKRLVLILFPIHQRSDCYSMLFWIHPRPPTLSYHYWLGFFFLSIFCQLLSHPIPLLSSTNHFVELIVLCSRFSLPLSFSRRSFTLFGREQFSFKQTHCPSTSGHGTYCNLVLHTRAFRTRYISFLPSTCALFTQMLSLLCSGMWWIVDVV